MDYLLGAASCANRENEALRLMDHQWSLELGVWPGEYVKFI
jgi:hypothetical protein